MIRRVTQLLGIPGKGVLSSVHLIQFLRKLDPAFYTTALNKMAKQAAYTKRMAATVVVREVEGEISELDPTIISRSVYVTGFQDNSAERLIIHFQQEKNGGKDIEKVIVSKKGTAVITFFDPKGEM